MSVHLPAEPQPAARRPERMAVGCARVCMSRLGSESSVRELSVQERMAFVCVNSPLSSIRVARWRSGLRLSVLGIHGEMAGDRKGKAGHRR